MILHGPCQNFTGVFSSGYAAWCSYFTARGEQDITAGERRTYRSTKRANSSSEETSVNQTHAKNKLIKKSLFNFIQKPLFERLRLIMNQAIRSLMDLFFIRS
jgi:hypothetical protein